MKQVAKKHSSKYKTRTSYEESEIAGRDLSADTVSLGGASNPGASADLVLCLKKLCGRTCQA